MYLKASLILYIIQSMFKLDEDEFDDPEVLKVTWASLASPIHLFTSLYQHYTHNRYVIIYYNFLISFFTLLCQQNKNQNKNLLLILYSPSIFLTLSLLKCILNRIHLLHVWYLGQKNIGNTYNKVQKGHTDKEFTLQE